MTSAAAMTAEMADHPHVLLVDDDSRLSDTLGEFLEEEGFRVSRAVDGREALSLLVRESFDVVLLDVCMPRLDGLGLLRAMEHCRPARELPVILMSGVLSGVELEALPGKDIAGRQVAHLAKPFMPSAVVKLVRRLLCLDEA